ncbi:sodium-dependent transporter [Kineothrix sp. MSJ-39]|uniref:sodium-dependent transporter n=1 Tax=Kineothrix sp. MSJ-39 TaxID=2841533 RepID=UPI001C11125F|nr:sodium-dependent transporter [Kineothrix sp. MSJ-39]MBU5430763.1 sodium-dependent transporter [Kineothrix sp. MSJ-39]
MKQKSGFSGQIGFVFAAAGSAVGVGNLWRFPYLAAKDGGGLFLLIYLVLVLTVGFTLLTTDIAIGRKTGKSAIYAYEAMRKKWKFLGVLTFLVPVLIMTYYAVIGGWILKYITIYLLGSGKEAVADNCFTSFISSPSSVWFSLVFMFLTALIVYNGVEKGIERVSKFIMPVLLIMVIGIAIFSLTLKTTLEDGTVRTGLQGLVIYLKPDLTGITVQRFLQISLDAMSQLFFSLSVSMGIMITYGSYVKKDVDLNKAVSQIELMDTGVAFLAGIMIIPAVFVFSGLDGMAAGPGLMFVSLPKVFYQMGFAGRMVGIIFFLLAAFAALTSCISVLESITANCMELFHTERKKTTGILSVIYLIATAVIALGYSVFYVEVGLPNGSTGQLLDIMDYISNSFLMPFIALLSSILIGWIMKPSWIAEEMELNGTKFKRKKLYQIMICFVMPVIMTILFLQSTGFLNLFMK